MQTLPSAPVEFLATPAPTGNRTTVTPTGGEESFSQHLANETSRESRAITADRPGRGTDSSPSPANAGPKRKESSDLHSPESKTADQSETGTPETTIAGGQTPLLPFTSTENQENLSTILPLTSSASNSKENIASALFSEGEGHVIQAPVKQYSDSLRANTSDTTIIPGRKTEEQLLQARINELLTPLKNKEAQQGGVQTVADKTSATTGTPFQQSYGNQQTPLLESLTQIVSPQQVKTTQQGNALQHTGSIQQSTENLRSPAIQLGNNDASPVVVEQWTATFKPAQETQQAVPQNQQNVNGLTSAETVIKTDNGQVITIYQSSEKEEMAVSSPIAGRAPTVDHSGQRQDSNSNYIHSNLPNNTIKAGLGTDGEQKNQTAGGEQQNNAQGNLQDVNELGPDTRMNREPAAAPFTLESAGSPTSPQATTSTSPGTGMLRLPSGILVPEGTVMDQVINHLSVNRRLESGTIRLQLHPKELGELRMEIEVKNDNVKAHITTQNPQAQEALDKHLPRLRETLEQQGLHLNEVEITVSAGDEYEGHRFSENEARQQLAKSFRSANSKTSFTPSIDEESADPDETLQNLSVTI